MEPSPTAYKFVPKILLPHYGWTHKSAGDKYGENEKSFRQTINAALISDRGFSVLVDRVERKIVVSFDSTKIAIRHDKWKKLVKSNIGLSQLNPQPYWGFDDLFHKVGTKLHNCFFVQADTKRENGHEWFHYKDILMLKGLSQDNFIKAIEAGEIYIDFDARTGHNHGTKFRMRQKIISNLYSECVVL